MIRLRLAALLVLAALVASACGTSAPSSNPTASSTRSAAPSSAEPASAEPGGGGSSAGPSEPASEPSEPPATESQSPAESASPDPSIEPGASAPPTAADACSGDQSIHDFFLSVARAVDWPVLCGVLPSGWFVSAGSYRLANGGKLVISYKGPAGATFALSEGAFCQDASGCVPSGSDAGDAAFGSMSGTLVALDGGDWAIVVDRGAALSWLLVTHGLDRATATSLAAALHEVAR